MDDKVKLSSLTDVEQFAFAYCHAQIGGKNSVSWKAFVRAERALKISGAQKRIDLQKGLRGLAERGLIDVQKNGEGDYEPVVLHLERVHNDLAGNLEVAGGPGPVTLIH